MTTKPSQPMYYWTCACGAEQEMSAEANRVYRQSHATFYCVHGHGAHYPEGPTEEDKLRTQLENERLARQRAEQRIAEKDDEAQTAWRTASAYKGQVTRLLNRAKAGVCPCCNRHFQQLERHMTNKHPGFTPDAASTDAGTIVRLSAEVMG